MFKKFKERIADCERRLNTQDRTLTNHCARFSDLYSILSKLMRNNIEYGCRKVDTTKSNADMLLDCLCDVKTDCSIFKDTNALFSVYISLRKSLDCKSLRILEYTVDKSNVYFEIEQVAGDTYD